MSPTGHLQHNCGVRAGARVLIDLQNSAHFVIALYAVLRAEVADRFAGIALAHLLVAGSPAWDAALAAGAAPSPSNAAPSPSNAAPSPSNAAPDDLCMLPYTSGSTGQPKGCMHTHAGVLHNVVGSMLWKHVTMDTVALATAPFFHVTGLVHSLLATVQAGGTIVIQQRWDPALAAELVERHRCTHWDNVPTMVVDLLSHPKAMQHDLSSLKWIFGGGAAMPEAIAQKLMHICGVEYVEGYGMTETISQTHMNPPGFGK